MLSLFFILFTSLFHTIVVGDAIQLTDANIDTVLSQHELVFINFYADWCHFSQMLKPIFQEAGKAVAENIGKDGRAVLGMIDCENQGGLCSKFNVNKYPTMKLFRFGKVTRNEYRSERSKSALENYVKEQLADPIEYSSQDMTSFEESKRYILGYFNMANVSEETGYNTFKKLASMMRNDCRFVVVDRSKLPQKPAESVVYHNGATNEELKYAQTDLTDFETIHTWAVDRCVPLVQVLTFQNAEELTEEGLPFFILFHHPDDKETPKKFAEVAHRDLQHQKYRVKLLTADGVVFSHPLMHLGKSSNDLPVLAIDSFKHMYVFPKDVKSSLNNGAILNQFLEDLHSGKLHREYHYGPDPVSNELPPAQDSNNNNDNKATTPPKSIFQKLAPSHNRYSLLKDEL